MAIDYKHLKINAGLASYIILPSLIKPNTIINYVYNLKLSKSS